MYNTKIIYELSAKGESVNDWVFKMRGVYLFETIEAAQLDIPRFFKECTDMKKLECAEEKSLKISIIERKLVIS